MTGPRTETSQVIDKELLYGKFQAGEDRRSKMIDWRDELHRRAVHKELDIADEEDVGDFNIDKSTRIGRQEVHHHHARENARRVAGKLGTLAKLAIGAGLIGTGAGLPFGVGLILDALKPKPAASVVQPEVKDTDTDTSMDIDFWDK